MKSSFCIDLQRFMLIPTKFPLSQFMATFYERLTDKANALDKRKAFEEAKQIVRKNHPDPYHWAAFVMLD